VSKGPDASPNGYEITFIGKELSRLTGQVGTEIGQNEGALTTELASPNIFGRGERISVHGSYSSVKSTEVNVRLSKPFLHTEFGDFKPE
jgi:outer membrane protein insertion porin family